jgi:hypothetical protein
MVILVATVCDKFVKVTMPPTAIRLVVPCNAPGAGTPCGDDYSCVISNAQVAKLIFDPESPVGG